MVRNLKEAALPRNPKWISIDASRSDGNPQRWPKNTDPTPDKEGNVNYMKSLEIDDGLTIKWRNIVGQALAEMLHYPGTEERNYVLKDWPTGYKFYDHHKGNVNGNIRHDLYLVGSDNVARFRSPAEFIPHVYWLMTDEQKNRDNCECKYCARRPQRGISDALGLSQLNGPKPSVAHFSALPRTASKAGRTRFAREARVFVNTRQKPKPLNLPDPPKYFSLPEREKDLYAILNEKKVGERRWAREGELVWVKLDYPIQMGRGGRGNEIAIQFWPGLIKEVFLKVEVTPNMINESSEEDVPWTISQVTVYKIKLLVVDTVVSHGSDHILPYQATAPSTELLEIIQSVIYDFGEEEVGRDDSGLPSGSQDTPETLESIQWKQFQQFNPHLDVGKMKSETEREEYRNTAAGAFAVAIQIASNLTKFWTPSDVWKYKALLPDNLNKSLNTDGASLNLSGEHQTLRSQNPGAQSKAQIEERRFQGLWWGPERIWMGDVVRLKLARYQLAPDGTNDIKKPSGTQKGSVKLVSGKKEVDTLDHMSLDEDVEMRDVNQVGYTTEDVGVVVLESVSGKNDSDGPGAANRSVFMRVDGIYIDTVPSEDGVHNECRICGMLYELADIEWDGTDEYADPPIGNSMQINDTSKESSPRNIFIPNPDLLSELPSDVFSSTDLTLPYSLESSLPARDSKDQTILNPTTPIAAKEKEKELAVDTPESDIQSKSTPSNSNIKPPIIVDAYPTPPAPNNMKFRPILREGCEAVVPLTMLAGRYYPGLLHNPLLRPRLLDALKSLHSNDNDALWALEGLVPGAKNPVDAHLFRPRRSLMMREAEKRGWEELVNYWREQVKDERS